MTNTYLFAVWAGGGNVPPQLTLARRLAARGHRVRMLAPAVLRERVEAAGLVFEPYRHTPEHDESDPARSLVRDFAHRSPVAAAKAVRDHLLLDMAAPIAADVLAVLDNHRVDAVATDYTLLGALFAAEKAEVPAAALVHHTYPYPAPGLPPFGMGWQPVPGLPGKLRDRLGGAMFNRLWAVPMRPRINEVRRALGLDPAHGVLDLIERTDRILVLTSRAFDFPAELPANVRYLGPQLEEPDWAPPWQPPWAASDPRPLVVVGLSTTYQRQESLLDATVSALGTLAVRGLVTTGPAACQASRVPANVHVCRYVPHGRALPYADAVVTHAGHGTVIAALAHGLPLVCLPMGRDQHDNAARVAWHGAGLRLSCRSSPARIAAAVRTVLDNAAYREAAQRIAKAIIDERPSHAGPEELEDLAATRTS